MKAVRIHGARDIRLEELPAPSVAPGKVLLDGGYSGLCGTDLHLFHAPDMLPLDFHRPQALTGAAWPQILGHEFSGRVSEIGDGVGGISVGDDVAVFPLHYCGRCPACQEGTYNNCPLIAFDGIQSTTGGMATTKLVDVSQVHVLPDGVDLKMGAIIEPMAVAWAGVDKADPDPGNTALVIGAGPIGLGACFALRARGVETIIVSEPSAQRRNLLAALGFEHVIDPTGQDVVDCVRSITDGRGVQVALDCAGSAAAFPDAMNCLGLRGRMVILAVAAQPMPLSTLALIQDRTIAASMAYRHEHFDAVIAAMQRGVYDLTGWVEVIPMTDVESAIGRLHDGTAMKLLVDVR